MPNHQRSVKERSAELNAFQLRIAARKAEAHAICLANRKPKKEKVFDWRHAAPEERDAWTKAKELRLANRA